MWVPMEIEVWEWWLGIAWVSYLWLVFVELRPSGRQSYVNLKPVYGVELAIRMGYSHIILKEDNATVFNGIGKQATGLAPSFVLFDRINSLKTFFAGFKCNLVGRNGNTVAHLVAAGTWVWWEILFSCPLFSKVL